MDLKELRERMNRTQIPMAWFARQSGCSASGLNRHLSEKDIYEINPDVERKLIKLIERIEQALDI